MSGPTFTFGTSYGDPAPAPAKPAGDLIKDTTTQTFAKDVLEASREVPVLVDFWAPWCGPCKQLTPVLEKVVKAAGGAVKLVKMNIDEHPQIAGQLGIQSIPAVIAFSQGRPLDGFMGALPESQVKQFIERVAGPVGPSDVEQLLEAAAGALAEKAFEQAAELFMAVLQEDPESAPALGGLARALIGVGQLDDARAVLSRVPAAKQADPAVAGARAELELADQAAKLGDMAELVRRVETHPTDNDARFELALALNARGERQQAADHLVEIVKRERGWNDEAARKQLVQFFEAWGPVDPATLYGRRKLSSVLFA
ncbi:thioredoxin [Mongoliimonas terrestris]|uniref:thioredoxin n=1 Tax=Mongoliimonas terrestris TaxID=1709001 RepID=UPI0009F8F3F5|nr:thioredoxin [Mongoliimonas terrestris]